MNQLLPRFNRKTKEPHVEGSSKTKTNVTDNAIEVTSSYQISPTTTIDQNNGHDTIKKIKYANLSSSNSHNNNSNMDREIIETEAKIKSQIQQLVIESDDNNDHYGVSRSKSIKNKGRGRISVHFSRITKSFKSRNKNPKSSGKLMTTAGVKLFDGLEEDIPDDQSLQEIIHKERSEKKSISKGGTNFISAPKNYDPVKSGFMNTKVSGGGTKKKLFYDSDEEEEQKRNNGNEASQIQPPKGILKNKKNIIQNNNHTPKSNVEYQDCIEVVIDKNSVFWKLGKK